MRRRSFTVAMLITASSLVGAGTLRAIAKEASQAIVVPQHSETDAMERATHEAVCSSCHEANLVTGTFRTVLPKRSVTIKDAAAYGLIVVQGEGTIGRHRVGAPTMIRFGEMTQDELFVSASAANAGVRIENASGSDPLVILKHFGPGNPDNEPLRALRSH